jgi:hypothetical protein
MKFADIKVGDSVVWDRHERYGGPVIMEVTKVMPTKFCATYYQEAWVFCFRKEDGRVIPYKHHCFWVEPWPVK